VAVPSAQIDVNHEEVEEEAKEPEEVESSIAQREHEARPSENTGQ
jgi:hypothetical protein